MIDTGADNTTISVSALKDKVDYTILEKGNNAVNIGGIQECYILHDVTLLLITDSEKIIEEKLKTVSFLPPIYDKKLGLQIPISSLLGRDIIGKKFELRFGNNEIYLQRENRIT